MKAITITVSFMWIFMMFVFGYAFDFESPALILSIGLLFFIVCVAVYIDSKKTAVEYDTSKIHWKWLCIDYTVNFSDVDSVHYTIVHERTRYGYNRRFEIVFRLKNSEVLRLNDRLESEDIESSINGTPDDIRLMQLYKFIENVCPEKCYGFVKSDGIF